MASGSPRKVTACPRALRAGALNSEGSRTQAEAGAGPDRLGQRLRAARGHLVTVTICPSLWLPFSD